MTMPRSVDARTALQFSDAVLQHFGWLEKRGFSITQRLPTLVRFHKNSLDVAIYHGRSSFELGFEITFERATYSLGEVIRLTNEELATQYRLFAATTAGAVDRGLADLSSLVRRYAEPALRGEPAFFASLAESRAAWIAKYEADVLAEQLRPKAADAFRRGDYREAAVLYERILSCLSPAEQKKLEFARKRAAGA